MPQRDRASWALDVMGEIDSSRIAQADGIPHVHNRRRAILLYREQ